MAAVPDRGRAGPLDPEDLVEGGRVAGEDRETLFLAFEWVDVPTALARLPFRGLRETVRRAATSA